MDFGMVLGIAVVLAIPITLITLFVRRGRPAAAPAGAAAAGAPPWYTRVPVHIGAFVATIALLVLLFDWARNAFGVMLAIGILGVLAVMAFHGRGGGVAKVGMGILALGLVLFGGRFPEGVGTVQKTVADATLGPKGGTPTPAQPAQAATQAASSGASTPTTPTNQAGGTRSGPVTSSDGITVYARYEFRVTSTEWSPQIPLVRGRCGAWLSEAPGSPGLVASTTERARPKDDSDWEEHLDGTPSHCAKTPRYFVRVRSAGDPTIAIVEIRKSGQCGTCP